MKWRVILFKLVLLADLAVFFEIEAYYVSEDFNYTGGEDSELDGKIKDFVLLYIFGLFALFVELYTKLSEIDQTAELKFDEQKKIEHIRKSVIGLNEEVEKARKNFLSDLKRKSCLQVEEVKHR